MSEHKPLGTEEELANAVDELFEAIPPPETDEEVDTFLRECGYEPVELLSRLRQVVDDAAANSPLNWRNRALKEMEGARARRDRIVVDQNNRDEIIAAIERLYTKLTESRRQLVPAAHFRNRENASDEDLADLLGDLEYLATEEG